MEKMNGIYDVRCEESHFGKPIGGLVTEAFNAREAEVSGYMQCRQAAGLENSAFSRVVLNNCPPPLRWSSLLKFRLVKTSNAASSASVASQ